jgi:hypothetical protein
MLTSYISKIRAIYIPALHVCHAHVMDTVVKEVQNKRVFVIQDHKFVL